MDWHAVWVWFHDVALDGVVGAAASAAVVIWALRRTIRHEDDQRRDDRIEAAAAERSRELAAFRRQIAELYGVLEQTDPGIGSQEDADRVVSLLRSELMLLRLEARRLRPEIEVVFTSLQAEVGPVERRAVGFNRAAVAATRREVLAQLLTVLHDSVGW